ncbi:hypothetical protein BJ912DRAFT_671506 [Pholiota molesta]|nr:hypothetical protein BJ912DRAFT_671506 [Pholiota molesta]
MIEKQNSAAAHEERLSDSRHALTSTYPCPTCGHKNIPSSSKWPKINFDRAATFAQLRSRYVPPPDERATIAATVQRYKTDIEEMRGEMAQLAARIRQMELAMACQGGLLAPIRQLPDELLTGIMIYCTRGKTVDVCVPRSGAWQLERVCKIWRDVAVSTPSMWSAIDVYLGGSRAPAIGTVKRLVQTSLERSKNRSLSIKFVELGTQDHFREVFRLFLQHSHRWKDISFSLSLLSYPPNLGHNLTRLHSLELSGAYKSSHSPLFDSFQHAQQLTKLRLHGVLKPFRSILLPWHQLRYCRAMFCEFGAGEFMEMLRHLPNLVELVSKWNKGLTRNRASSSEPLTLRSLERLEIDAAPPELFTALQPLALPALTALHIATHQAPGTTAASSHIVHGVVGLLQRSAPCRVTALSLCAIDAAGVCRILEETPDVASLELGYILDVAGVLAALSGSHALVPNMGTFSVECSGEEAMRNVGLLTEIVRFRGVRSRHPRDFLGRGKLHRLVLTVREDGGDGGRVQPLADLLQPLSRVSGVKIIIRSMTDT